MKTFLGMPVPGFRNIKTAIAVVLCMLLYEVISRDGLLLATTAALICMQDSIERSINLGLARVKGTFMGGFMGIVFAYLYNHLWEGESFVFYLSCCFAGIVGLIYILNLINQRQTIVVAGFVFLVIMIDVEGSTVVYSLNRVLDTLIGIGIAVTVNRYLLRPSPEKYRGQDTLNPTFHYEIKRAQRQKRLKLTNTRVAEIYIFPEDAIYSEKDFDFRLSVTNIDASKCDFTQFPGYRRHLMLLEGEATIVHSGHHSITLTPFERDVFKGDWKTWSSGYCLDLNLIVREGFVGSLEPAHLLDSYELKNDVFTGFYFVEDNIKVIVTTDNNYSVSETVNRGDFFMISWFRNGSTNYTIAFEAPAALEFEGEGPTDAIVAVKVSCIT